MLGNQYGKSVTHPVRRFEPTSQQVLSDQEFNTGWQDKLSAVPQFLQVAYEEAATQPENWYTPAPDKQTPGTLYGGSVSDSGPGGATQYFGAGQPTGGYGTSVSDVGPGGASMHGQVLTGDPSGLGMVTKYRQEANPEWQRIKNEMEAAMQFRQQNQTAQQQAYNGMLDQGQKNGVMGPGYSNPGFGRVDGQAQNPYSVDPGSNNMNWAAGYDVAPTGVYDPLQQTQETFWGL